MLRGTEGTRSDIGRVEGRAARCMQHRAGGVNVSGVQFRARTSSAFQLLRIGSSADGRIGRRLLHLPCAMHMSGLHANTQKRL